MDYQQFLFTITAGLQSAYPADEKVTVQTTEQKHTAKIKTVSLYHRGKRTTPLIYMAPFYRMYQHGHSLENIQKELKSVLDMVARNKTIEGEVFTEFASASTCLTIRLISYQSNQEFLKLVPHRRILDFAVVYQLVFEGTEENAGMMGAAVVYHDHCRIWNVTEDILFQTALSTMMRRFRPALNSVESLIGVPMQQQSGFPHLFALSNNRAFFGAAVILYPGVLRKASQRLGGAYYILPSSVHEMLLLAKTGTGENIPMQLKAIVEEVNLTDAVSTEFLSNHVYAYNPESDEVCIVI